MIRMGLIVNRRIKSRLLELGYTQDDMSAIRWRNSVRKSAKLTSSSEHFLLLCIHLFMTTVRLEEDSSWPRRHDCTTQGCGRKIRVQSSSATAHRHLEDIIYVLPAWVCPLCMETNAAVHGCLHVRCVQVRIGEPNKGPNHRIQFFSCNGRVAELNCSVATGESNPRTEFGRCRARFAS